MQLIGIGGSYRDICVSVRVRVRVFLVCCFISGDQKVGWRAMNKPSSWPLNISEAKTREITDREINIHNYIERIAPK